MNYQKLDAALAMALDEVKNPQEASLVVFVQTEKSLNPQAVTFLNGLGIKGVMDGIDIYTVTVSSSTVSQLSQQPWIKLIKLSQKLRFM